VRVKQALAQAEEAARGREAALAAQLKAAERQIATVVKVQEPEPPTLNPDLLILKP